MTDAVERARDDFQNHGFAHLPGYLADDLAPALAELPALFPAADAFHDDTGRELNRRFLDDEFAGITTFPFPSLELNLLTVHPRLVALAAALLDCEDIRIYSAEGWAKYAGAATYDQPLHRDYLNHTLLVPADSAPAEQVEIFVFLCDVPEALGPPHFVSTQITRGAPAMPNWFSRDQRPEWFAAEVSSAGPAGTAIAYRIETFHRATELTRPRGARYTLHVSFRRASLAWADRIAWANVSHGPAWYDFVARADARQLQLFGFPPPGHAVWTDATVADMTLRYRGRDFSDFLRK